MVHTSPWTRNMLNEEKLKSIPLRLWTRLGCPLLRYFLSLIESSNLVEEYIRGTNRSWNNFTYIFYDSIHQGPQRKLQLVSTFTKVTWYNIKHTKNCSLPIHQWQTFCEINPIHSNIKNNTISYLLTKIKYKKGIQNKQTGQKKPETLGINLTMKVKDLYNKNFRALNR